MTPIFELTLIAPLKSELLMPLISSYLDKSRLKFQITSLQALITLFVALGIQKATSTIIKFPAFVLTAAFTLWTFGPVSSTSCCIYRIKEPKIHLSYRFTWINAVLTSCITGGLCFVELWEPFTTGMIFGGISLALLSFSLITLALIQCLKRCSCLCCSYSCVPIKPKTIYNTEMEEKY